MAERFSDWQMPPYSPDEIVDFYVGLVKAVSGPVKVWARVQGGRVHFITLITDSPRTERELHEAELRVYEKFGAEHVEFDLHRDPQMTSQASEESRLVLQHA